MKKTKLKPDAAGTKLNVKTITKVITIVGKENQRNLDRFTQVVFDKCKEFNITKTSAGHELTLDIINRIIRNVLSQIKLGKGHWNTWSYRLGNDMLKLYENDEISIKTIKTGTLEGFDYVNTPIVAVHVNPHKSGVEMPSYYKTFDSISQAEIFMMSEDMATELYLAVGKVVIPIDRNNLLG